MSASGKVPAETVIAAVSGGVDSVVMLHLLASRSDLDAVVAHFDHGIRADSAADARFVAALAAGYGLKCELGRARLGPRASEDQARRARHAFLRKVRDKYAATQILTAHHRADLIETAIINLLRGTGRAGMSSLKNTGVYSRPLITWTREKICEYAAGHRLEWVEDETNLSEKYLRNRVRYRLVPLMKRRGAYADFGRLVDWFADKNPQIDALLDAFIAEYCEVTRDHTAVPLGLLADDQLGGEVLAGVLRRAGARQIDSAGIGRALRFARIAAPGRTFNQFPPLRISRTEEWLLVAGKSNDSV
jgi:tRNA(Ile)-lysidine synthetase-like protein